MHANLTNFHILSAERTQKQRNACIVIKRKENIFGISSHACVHVTLLLQEGASTFSSTKISTQAFLGYIIFQPSWGSNIG